MKYLIYFIIGLIIFMSLSVFAFGERVRYKLPKNMNSFFTYHSLLSNKNYDYWLTAQKIHGEICLKSSYILLPLNIFLIMILFVFIKYENIILYLSFFIFVFDLLWIVIIRFKTEKLLRKLEI